MKWNFKPTLPTKYIEVPIFAELREVSESNIHVSIRNNNPEWAIKKDNRVFVNDNYFKEFHEKHTAFKNYAHAIYSTLSYAYGLNDSRIAFELAHLSDRRKQAWIVFLADRLYAISHSYSYISTSYQEMIAEFLYLGSKVIYREFIQKNIKPKNDIEYFGLSVCEVAS